MTLKSYNGSGPGELPMNAYLYCMRHYADFSGRASRSEYWLFVLTFLIIYAACLFIDYAIVGTAPSAIPALSTMKALTISVRTGSGLPIAAAMATAGWRMR